MRKTVIELQRTVYVTRYFLLHIYKISCCVRKNTCRLYSNSVLYPLNFLVTCFKRLLQICSGEVDIQIYDA